MKKAPAKNNKARKILVRNSIIPAGPCEVVREKKQVQFAEEIEETTEIKKDLSSPEFLSVLKIAEEIKKVQLQSRKECKKRETDRRSRSYNLNFDPDEKLYHDLISLEVPNEEFQPKLKNIHPYKNCMKKDPEPDFKELLKYSPRPGYVFTKFITPEVKKPVPEFDGRSIYNLSKRWTIQSL